MIIDQSELIACKEALTGNSTYLLPHDHFLENAHLLLATYFDQYVSFGSNVNYPRSLDWSVEGLWDEFSPKDQIFFRRPGGQWLWLYLGDEDHLWFHSYTTWSKDIREEPSIASKLAAPEKHFAFAVKTEVFLADLENTIRTPINDVKEIISPLLWTPVAQDLEKHYLQNATRDILLAIWDEQIELQAIHWKKLEEIVAELLRAQGMKIHLVKESPQGGRDVVAQGEFIFGNDPLTIAVEVKQRAVVDRPQVEMALHQNRHFPALLFATAGRFSAGVIEEQALPENRYRLFLRDGVAIKDMIARYGIKQGW